MLGHPDAEPVKPYARIMYKIIERSEYVSQHIALTDTNQYEIVKEHAKTPTIEKVLVHLFLPNGYPESVRKGAISPFFEHSLTPI